MLKRIDILVIDLPDVGTRVYTYGTTMGLCVEAAAEYDVKVVVLDRPDPIGGVAVEGNLCSGELSIFCRTLSLAHASWLDPGGDGRLCDKIQRN